MGNQLLRDGKKSQFDFVSILSAGADQGPAASLHNRRGGRWGLLRLNPSHATHAPSVRPSLVRHLTQPPCFLLACPKFTWTVEVSHGRQARKRTYGCLRKRKSRMLPLSVRLLPVFPTSYANEGINRSLFCSVFFFCVHRHATPWNIGWPAAISVRWLKLAQPLSVCNTVYMRLGDITCGIPVGLKSFLLLLLLRWVLLSLMNCELGCTFCCAIATPGSFLRVVQFWANVADGLASLLGTLDIGTQGNWSAEGRNLLLINHWMRFFRLFCAHFHCQLLVFTGSAPFTSSKC